MPKVTQSYRDRQTAKILAAARTCFARRGFHATSMDEIIAEVGMSSSTVYRYFPDGKRSLIRAVTLSWVDPVMEWISTLAAEPDPPELEEVFVEGMRRTWVAKVPSTEDGSRAPTDAERREHLALMLDIWAEYSRDPSMHELGESYRMVRSRLVALVELWRARGLVTDRVTAQEAAGMIHSATLGLLAEEVVMGSASVEATARVIGRLLEP